MYSKIELYGAMREAIRLGEYVDYEEYRFCRKMADAYGCTPLQIDGDNLYKFLQTLYHYGKVQGIRQERAKRRKKQKSDHEVIEIARILAEKPLLYQVMETAAEVQLIKAIKQVTGFLKGAKKNED